MSRPTVASLHLYPVKSAAGVSVPEARTADGGFRHDRRWMLVDDDGVFLSQRAHPALARVRLHLEEDRIRCRRPGAADLELPLRPDAPTEDGDRVEVQVWSDRLTARLGPEPAHAWFSDHLGFRCRLVGMPDDARRQVDPVFARPGEVVSFADGFPFLLVEQASLDDLNDRLAEPVPMDRFRPNLVVAGTEPLAADGWRRLRAGEVVFRVAKPCARCVVTTVDQETGRKGGEAAEPLRTLATYRRTDHGVVFGQNLVHETRGVVRVGDPVEVLE